MSETANSAETVYLDTDGRPISEQEYRRLQGLPPNEAKENEQC